MRLQNFFLQIGLIIGAAVPLIGHAVIPESPAVPSNTLGLNLSLAGSSYKTPALDSVVFGPSIQLVYLNKINPNFDVRTDVAVEVLTGSASGLMPTDLMNQAGPRQIVRLREAAVDLHTADRDAAVGVGAINQRVFGNPLLLGDMAFLGAFAEVKHESRVGRVSFKLEHAVPPTSFSSLETARAGKTPTFTAAQVADLVGDEKSDFFGVSAGYFQFADLTTAQARQSLFWGNTVVGNTNSAAFYLPFRGIEGGARSGLRINERWQLLASTNFVRNAAAPAGSNVGYLATLGASLRLAHAKIGFGVGYFDDQSDTSPAVFNDGFLNPNNHRGLSLELSYDTEKYALFARALRSEALVSQLYAGENVGVIIGVRVHYDLF